MRDKGGEVKDSFLRADNTIYWDLEGESPSLPRGRKLHFGKLIWSVCGTHPNKDVLKGVGCLGLDWEDWARDSDLEIIFNGCLLNHASRWGMYYNEMEGKLNKES